MCLPFESNFDLSDPFTVFFHKNSSIFVQIEEQIKIKTPQKKSQVFNLRANIYSQLSVKIAASAAQLAKCIWQHVYIYVTPTRTQIQ